MLQQVEAPYAAAEGQNGLAGAYEGLPPLMVLPPSRHFWGDAHRAYQYGPNQVSILEYRYSGVPGDWTFLVEMYADGEKMVWRGMRQLKRPSWSYDAIPTFEFDLLQYRDALQEASTRAY